MRFNAYHIYIHLFLCFSLFGFKGDGGGPLNFRQTNGWKQIGITSFLSSLGCESGGPNGFTRISYYSKWIADTIYFYDWWKSTTVPTTAQAPTTAPTTTSRPATLQPNLSSTTAINKPTDFSCIGKPSGNYPDPTSSCSNIFYMCSNGLAYDYVSIFF